MRDSPQVLCSLAYTALGPSNPLFMSSTPESFTTPDPQSVDESEPVPTPDTVIDPPERYLTVEELSERAQSELDRALDSYSIPSAVTRAFQRTACWTRYAHYLTTTPIEESVSQPSPKALQEVGDDVSEVQPLSLLSGRGPKRCSKSSWSHSCHKLTFQDCFHPTTAICPLRQSRFPPIRIPVCQNALASNACNRALVQN